MVFKLLKRGKSSSNNLVVLEAQPVEMKTYEKSQEEGSSSTVLDSIESTEVSSACSPPSSKQSTKKKKRKSKERSKSVEPLRKPKKKTTKKKDKSTRSLEDLLMPPSLHEEDGIGCASEHSKKVKTKSLNKLARVSSEPNLTKKKDRTKSSAKRKSSVPTNIDALLLNYPDDAGDAPVRKQKNSLDTGNLAASLDALLPKRASIGDIDHYAVPLTPSACGIHRGLIALVASPISTSSQSEWRRASSICPCSPSVHRSNYGADRKSHPDGDLEKCIQYTNKMMSHLSSRDSSLASDIAEPECIVLEDSASVGVYTNTTTKFDQDRSLREMELDEMLQLEKHRSDDLARKVAALEKKICDLQSENERVNAKMRREQRDTERTMLEKDKEIYELSDAVNRILEAERSFDAPRGGAARALHSSINQYRLEAELEQANAKLATTEKCLSDVRQDNNRLSAEIECYRYNSKSPAMQAVEAFLQIENARLQEQLRFKDESIGHLMEQLRKIKQAQPSIDGSLQPRVTSDMDTSGHAGPHRLIRRLSARFLSEVE